MKLSFNIQEFGYNDKLMFKEQSFDLEGGKIYGLVGENGIGKSTLINLIAGNLNGKIEISQGNKNIVPGFNDTILYLAEDFAGLEYLTVRETAEYYCSLYGADFDEEKFNYLLSVVNLDGRNKEMVDRVIKNISKGTKEKAVFLIAFFLDLDVLLVDEELENLDSITMSQILMYMKKWTNVRQKCCMIATHNNEILDNVEQKILLRREGEAVSIYQNNI